MGKSSGFAVHGPMLTLAVLVSGGSALTACGAAPAVEPPMTITIATGEDRAGSGYYLLGNELAQIYSRRVPGVQAVAPIWKSYEINADAIQRGDADLAFIGGDGAYSAYRRGTKADARPHTRLRGVAVLYSSAVQILARRDTIIHRVGDLGGRTVGIGGPRGGEVATAIETILEAHGLNYRHIQPMFYTSVAEMATMMRDRALDVGIFYRAFPLVPLLDVTRDVRLIPIEREKIEVIQARSPFLKSIIIPRGTYADQAEDITALGVDNLLVCREDLPEPLVRDLTKTLFQALPELSRTVAAARAIDPERAPATPIPLHPGAARYYRERELAR